jgi:Ca-activated chloride channel homolog
VTLQFAHPAALLLLLPLLVLGVWLWRGRGAAVPLPQGSLLRRSGAATRLLARGPLILRLLVLLFLVLAIAGPRTPGETIEEETLGVPIVIALDMSSSMLVRDLGDADRLTVAKDAIRQFARDRERDPIGLVVFAGESLTLVPITMHRRILAAAVDQIIIGLLEDGTAVGEGLATAVARLRGVEAESRVVILMSDGANNRGVVQPLEAAQAAAALGIQVHTIGVGSDRPAPVSAVPGHLVQEAPGGLDEALLREVARLTGGQYFRADQPGALERIYGEIDRLVASPVQTRRHQTFREWHLPLLLLAGGALLLEWVLRASRWGVLP